MPNKYHEFREVTPTLDTGTAYADGDLLANPVEIEDFFPLGYRVVTVDQVIVQSDDDVPQAFDIYFTKLSTSWGTLNSAVDITDTIMNGITGKISIAAADYDDFVDNQLAIAKDQRVRVEKVSQSQSIYVALVARGAGTFSNADGLTLRFAIEI